MTPRFARPAAPSRHGVTLIELLVGIFIALIAGGIAFLLLKDEHSNYTSLKARVKLQSDARDAVRIMESELVNTGLNVGNIMAGGDLMTQACPHAFVSASDSSSFDHTDGDPGDVISFGQYLLDEDGLPNCENANSRWTRYRLVGNTLLRATAPTLAMLANAPEIPLLGDVLAFQVQYGLQSPQDLLWDSTNANKPVPTGALTVTDSGGGWNIKGWTNGLEKVQFPAKALELGDRIKISLHCTPNADFANTTTGWARFVVGLDDGDLDTIRIYPGMTGGRRVEVDVVSAEDANQKLIIAGNMKMSTGAPSIHISSLEVRRTSQASYTWVDTPTQAQKKQVRAMRLFLLVNSKDKSMTVRTAPWTGIGNLGSIDPKSAAAGKATVLFERMIPVVNNGH